MTTSVSGIVSGVGGSLTKEGTGTLTLTAANTYTGGTTINGGSLLFAILSGSGSGCGPVTVKTGATLGGTGTIGGSLTVESGGLVMQFGGTLIVNGAVINNGTMRFVHGASFVVGNGSTFINNGTLDIMTGSFSTPGGFVNNGTVLDSSVIKVKTISLNAAAVPAVVTVTINGYTGHMYQLERSTALDVTAFSPVSGVPMQAGTTGGTLTFTDPAAPSNQAFYRVRVDP